MYFVFLNNLCLNKGDTSQINTMYSGRVVPKIEPNEAPRSPWMAPPPRLPSHAHCKNFLFLFYICLFNYLLFNFDLI